MKILSWSVIILIAMMAFRTAAGEPIHDPAKTAKIKAFELRLAQTAEQCKLAYIGPSIEGSIELQLSTPCDFHRTVDGKPRVMSLGQMDIILIESSRPNPEWPSDCKTRIQGVRMIGQRVSVSQSVARVAACPPFQWDEKMFIGLFE
jgi:hypothetical protein